LREFCEVPVPIPCGILRSRSGGYETESGSKRRAVHVNRADKGQGSSGRIPTRHSAQLNLQVRIKATLGSAFQIERQCNCHGARFEDIIKNNLKIAKVVPLHAMKALGGRGSIAPTQS
jgi:hypothetical protein